MDFSRAADVNKFFDELLNEIKSLKVTNVYSNGRVLTNNGRFSYMQDTPIYIIFDNGQCLIVDYMFIDELNMEYRQMNETETQDFIDSTIKDSFNRTTPIFDLVDEKRIIAEERSELPYGCIIDIETEKVTESYSAWSNGDIIEREPNDNTFCSIKFVMDNGKSFYISPASAEIDGYSYLWSNDSTECEIDIQ